VPEISSNNSISSNQINIPPSNYNIESQIREEEIQYSFDFKVLVANDEEM